MKRFFASLFAAVLSLGSVAALFAGCASAGERTLTSIQLTTLPDKLEYELFDENNSEAGFKVDDIFLKDNDFELDNIAAQEYSEEQILDAVEKAEFFVNIDMTGAKVTAYYNDGSLEAIDNSLVDVKLENPANLQELHERYSDTLRLIKEYVAETDDGDKKMEIYLEYAGLIKSVIREICQGYSVEVSYKGMKTDFSVQVYTNNGEWIENEDTSVYEFVSYDDPMAPRTFSLSNDFEVNDFPEDTDDENAKLYQLWIQDKNITVTVRNKGTGETVTLDGGQVDIYYECDTFSLPDSGPQEAYGNVWVGDEEVTFLYEFELINDLEQTY